VGVHTDSAYSTTILRLHDTLTGASDLFEVTIQAADAVRQVVGAQLSPVFLVSDTGADHVLVADDRQRTILGEAFEALPVEPYVRRPWLNRGELPVWGVDNPEAWRLLPEEFRAHFALAEVCVPIHAGGRHFGAMLLAFEPEFRPTTELTEFLTVVGCFLGGTVHRWHSARRERELGALEERRRLSDELHVDLSQQIAALGLHVGLVELDLTGSESDSLTEDVRQLGEKVDGLKQNLRNQMLGLRADAGTLDESLVDRVTEQVEVFRRQTGLPVRLECADPRSGRIPPVVAAQIVRVLQESFANVRLHAQASSVTVRLLLDTARVRLEVHDDGVGFDPDEVPASRLGLRIMAERLQQVDGVLRIDSRAGGGTAVLAEAPLRCRDTGGVEIEAMLRRG